MYCFGLPIIRSKKALPKPEEDRGHCTVSTAEGGHGTALLFHSPACQATTSFDSEMGMRIIVIVNNKSKTNNRKDVREGGNCRR